MNFAAVSVNAGRLSAFREREFVSRYRNDDADVVVFGSASNEILPSLRREIARWKRDRVNNVRLDASDSGVRKPTTLVRKRTAKKDARTEGPG
jgi:hypothetical protein